MARVNHEPRIGISQQTAAGLHAQAGSPGAGAPGHRRLYALQDDSRAVHPPPHSLPFPDGPDPLRVLASTGPSAAADHASVDHASKSGSPGTILVHASKIVAVAALCGRPGRALGHQPTVRQPALSGHSLQAADPSPAAAGPFAPAAAPTRVCPHPASPRPTSGGCGGPGVAAQARWQALVLLRHGWQGSNQ